MSDQQNTENPDSPQEALHPGVAQEHAEGVAPPVEALRQPGDTVPPAEAAAATTTSAAGSATPARSGTAAPPLPTGAGTGVACLRSSVAC